MTRISAVRCPPGTIKSVYVGCDPEDGLRGKGSGLDSDVFGAVGEGFVVVGVWDWLELLAERACWDVVEPGKSAIITEYSTCPFSQKLFRRLARYNSEKVINMDKCPCKGRQMQRSGSQDSKRQTKDRKSSMMSWMRCLSRHLREFAWAVSPSSSSSSLRFVLGLADDSMVSLAPCPS